jgi:hypothetical protein
MKTGIYLFIAAMTASISAIAQERVTPGNHYVPADRIPWAREAGAPVELGALWGDRSKGEAGTLLRTPAGFQSGLHSHTADYQAVVVQGVWKHWVPSTGEGIGIRLEHGAHWTQVKTQLHEDVCISAEPCTILLLNKKPYRTEYPLQGRK